MTHFSKNSERFDSRPWLRLYAEFAGDPKVQTMPEAMQRRLIMLLCLRCGNSLNSLTDEEIARALRISDMQLKTTKKLFISRGFIDQEWNIQNWDKRQFSSDCSTSEFAVSGTLLKRFMAVSETHQIQRQIQIQRVLCIETLSLLRYSVTRPTLSLHTYTPLCQVATKTEIIEESQPSPLFPIGSGCVQRPAKPEWSTTQARRESPAEVSGC